MTTHNSDRVKQTLLNKAALQAALIALLRALVAVTHRTPSWTNTSAATREEQVVVQLVLALCRAPTADGPHDGRALDSDDHSGVVGCRKDVSTESVRVRLPPKGVRLRRGSSAWDGMYAGDGGRTVFQSDPSAYQSDLSGSVYALFAIFASISKPSRSCTSGPSVSMVSQVTLPPRNRADWNAACAAGLCVGMRRVGTEKEPVLYPSAEAGVISEKTVRDVLDSACWCRSSN